MEAIRPMRVLCEATAAWRGAVCSELVRSVQREDASRDALQQGTCKAGWAAAARRARGIGNTLKRQA
jgi:hypothetical protein